jgi:hypothetical protein
MNRPVLIHGVLLAGALIAAYFVWTREPSGSEDEISILAIRSGLDKVVYAGEDRTVTLDRKKDERGTYYGIRVETLETPPAPPASQPTPAAKDAPLDGEGKAAGSANGAASAKPVVPSSPKPSPAEVRAKVRKVQQFLGNRSTEILVAGLSNFSAVRSLGQLEGEKLKTFGLTDSKKSLTLVSGSSPRVFILGGSTYGNLDNYIKDKEDGRVYVIRPKSIQDMLYAESRLMERGVHSFKLSELDRAVITVRDTKKAVLQKNREDQLRSFWVDEGSPDRRKDFYKNWFDKIDRVRVLEYTQPGKKIDGLSSIFSIEYFLGSKKLGTLKLFKQQTLIPKVAGSDEHGAGDYYAETEDTRMLVKISRQLGDELNRDISSLLKE